MILVYHDAVWANVPNEAEHEDFNETKHTGIYSQLGYGVLVVNKNTFRGEPGQGFLGAWECV